MDKEDIGKPIRIALVQTQYSLACYQHEPWMDEKDRWPAGWTRMTEFVEVTFLPRPVEEWVPEAHKALDKEEAEAQRAMHNTLNNIADRRAQLYQITHQPDAPARTTQQEAVNEVLGGTTFDDDIPF